MRLNYDANGILSKRVNPTACEFTRSAAALTLGHLVWSFASAGLARA